MKSSKPPMRKCVGCNTSKPQRDLIRMTNLEGRVTVDLTGNAEGRGFYLCRDMKCLEGALKKRAFLRVGCRELSAEQKAELVDEIKRKEES